MLTKFAKIVETTALVLTKIRFVPDVPTLTTTSMEPLKLALSVPPATVLNVPPRPIPAKLVLLDSSSIKEPVLLAQITAKFALMPKLALLAKINTLYIPSQLVSPTLPTALNANPTVMNVPSKLREPKNAPSVLLNST
jgi:hypothetical protein